MRHFRLIAFAMLVLAIMSISATAQRKTIKKKPKQPTVVKTIPPLDVRAAREKSENQLENVQRFVDEYGPKADALELLDKAFATKTVSDAILAKHSSNKKMTIQSIRNLRDGLTALESEFRTKPTLQKYLSSIQGITELATQSEDSAIAGRFVAAKDPLRDIVMKLTDTLAVLPK